MAFRRYDIIDCETTRLPPEYYHCVIEPAVVHLDPSAAAESVWEVSASCRPWPTTASSARCGCRRDSCVPLMNWTARGSALGGIYGRAIVVGNQTHFTIGALLLAARGLDAGGQPPGYWALAGVYGLGAAFFACLLFFSDGLRRG